MRSKSNIFFALFLSFLLIFSNLAFIYAEDEVVDDTTSPQVEQVVEEKQEEPQVEKEAKTEIIEEVDSKNVIEDIEEESTVEEELTKAKTEDDPDDDIEGEATELHVHLQYRDTKGNWTETICTLTWNQTKALNKITTIPSSPTSTDTTFIYEKKWKTSSNTEPIDETYKIKASDYKGKTDIYFKAIYTPKPAIIVTLNFEDIKQPTGAIKTASNSNTIFYKNSWSISKKTLESITGLTVGKTFNFMGYQYTYNGEWTDGTNKINANKTIYFYNKTGENKENTYYLDETTTFTFKPVWEKTKVNGLNYNYIDNISTGSGSWSNADAFEYYSAFGSFTHTFSDPSVKTPVNDYRFLEWKDEDNNISYNAGDSFTYTVYANRGNQEYWIYAYWQPIVTVNYYDEDGTLIDSITNEAVDIYADCAAPQKDTAFLGWYEDGIEVSQDTIIHLNPTREKVQTEFNVYAKYAEPEPEPELEPEPTPNKPKPSKKPTEPTSTDTDTDDIVVATTTTNPPTTISNPKTPAAAPEPERFWALLNLILSILTIIFGLIFILHRKDDDLEVEDKRKVNIAKLIAALVALISIIVFIFTEDMTATMAWIDKWTIVMAIILLGEFGTDYYIHKKSQYDEEKEEGEE